MTEQRKPGTFKKNDPRINRNGRPKSFDALRALAQEIAHEKAKAGGNTVVIDGHSVTVTEAILRQWAQSKNPVLQQRFIEVAFGRVPQAIDITSDGKPITGYAKVSPDDWDNEPTDEDATGD